MGDTFFKVVIRDASWDVRSEAKRLGFLFQLFIDAKKPKEVFIKYKTVKDAERARACLAENENVVRVESMEKWDIRPKKPTENQDDTVSCAGSTTSRYAPYKGPMKNGPIMSEPLPLMMGLFNMCSNCRKGGAAFQCFVCGTYYCSEVCQRAEWPMHITQCLPRLVRSHTGIIPNEPQPMGFPESLMMQTCGNNPNNVSYNGPAKADQKSLVPNQPPGNKESGPNRKQTPNNRPPTSSKPSGQQPKQVETSPAKVTPWCSVPTNVLKNLALQRHQGQETVTTKPAANANVESQPSSKLVKRMQQKVAAPKREIRYGPFPQEGEVVKLTYVTENMLYVYRTGQEANGQPNRYIDFVKRSVACARDVKQMLPSAPKVGDIAFAPFDGDFYRAVVKSIEGTRVVVFFPDFGNTQTVEVQEMKEIPDKEIQYGMCYTHGVKIDGVATFTPLVRSFLSELLELDEFELIKVRDEQLAKTVDMRHVQELYQLSAKLLEVAKKEQGIEKAAEESAAKETAATVPTVAAASYVPVTAEEFTEHDLPIGEMVKLMIVEASELNTCNQVSVITCTENAEFCKVISDCERCGQNDPLPYHPKSDNEAFLLHFDGVWCRAMLASSGEEAQYYLLDLGIIRSVDERPNCRRYPAEMTRKIFVCECFVDNPDALGNSTTTGNNEHLLGKTLNATISMQTDGAAEGMHLKIHSIE